MSLKSELQKIINLDNPFNEASKKLYGTWMLVNGVIVQIRQFEEHTAYFYNENGDSCKEIVKTLETWLPESGNYKLSTGNFVTIIKTAKRQWLKSFHDSFYSIHVEGKKPLNYLNEIAHTKKQDILVDKNKTIWWWNTTIGYVKNHKTIVCTNKNFIQELIDWSKNT